MVDTQSPNRAAFVTHEFRYKESSDTSVLTKYPQAVILEVDSNLGSVDAAALASTYLTSLSTFAQSYQVTTEGAAFLDDFATSPPRWTLNAPRYSTDGRTFQTAAVEIDYVADTSTWTLRG